MRIYLYFSRNGLGWFAEKLGFQSGSTGMSVIFGLGFVLGCMVIPYFIGSFNSSVFYSKIFRHDDIRKYGSGNAGATNILRTYGKRAAAVVFGMDMLRTAVAVLLGGALAQDQGAAVAGFFVILGHMFPLYYRFRGGKGVACSAVVVLMMNPLVFALLFLIFIIIVVGTKFVSLGSIMCIMLYPVVLSSADKVFYGGMTGLPEVMAVLMAIFVVWRHKDNIKRLREGKENKISLGKKKKPDDIPVRNDDDTEDDSDKYTKCTSCLRLMPVSRKKCAYCGHINENYVAPAREEKKKHGHG